MAPKRNTKTKKENVCLSAELSKPELKRQSEGKANKPIDTTEDVDTPETLEPHSNGAAEAELKKKTEKTKSKGRSKDTKAATTHSDGDDEHIDEKPAKRGRLAKTVEKPISSKDLKEKNGKSVSGKKESAPKIATKLRRGKKNEEPVTSEVVVATTITQDEPMKKTKKGVAKNKEPTKRVSTHSEQPTNTLKVAEKESVEIAPVKNKRSREPAATQGAGPKEVNKTIELKPKAAGRSRATEKVVEPLVKNALNVADVEVKKAPRRKREAAKREETSESEPKKKATKTLQNKTATDYTDFDVDIDQFNASGQPWNFKISSWNIDGIRAWIKKGGLEYINQEKPDIICLQETKCRQDQLPGEAVSLPGFHPYWLCSDKDGYAGVGIYTKKMAIHVQYGLGDEELDSEGRIITAEYEQFFLISTYVPNAGRKLVTLPKKLKWNDVFRQHVNDLNKKKPVIICGDMNVAHNEIDIANPKTNKKNAGFTQEERDGMTQLLGDGFVDTFRHLHPEQRDAYTFWTYMSNARAKNVGWRLDYMIVSQRLVPSLCDSIIRKEIYGSDHCPITLFLHLSGFEKLSL